MTDHFGDHDIPTKYGACPRCGGGLLADVYECSTTTGLPTEYGFHVFCKKSHEDLFAAMAEAQSTGNYSLTRTVEQCHWDYDEALDACDSAWRYLRKL